MLSLRLLPPAAVGIHTGSGNTVACDAFPVLWRWVFTSPIALRYVKIGAHSWTNLKRHPPQGCLTLVVVNDIRSVGHEGFFTHDDLGSEKQLNLGNSQVRRRFSQQTSDEHKDIDSRNLQKRHGLHSGVHVNAISDAGGSPQADSQSRDNRLKSTLVLINQSIHAGRGRKIRCVWQAPTDKVCAGCKARGRECVPQVYQRRSVNSDRLTSRDRISRLEAQIANLTSSATERKSSLTSPVDDEYHDDDDGPDTPLDDSEVVDEPSEGPTATPPTHLKFLFDNALIGPEQYDENPGDDLSKARCSPRYLEQARTRLQRLMPPRKDVTVAASYADPWMKLYTTLFPTEAAVGTRNNLTTDYEPMLTPDAHPVHIAFYLLTFAITVRQIPPPHAQELSLSGWENASVYAREVSHAVEATIIAHTGIASTIDGIETTVMYLRLQLGMGNIKPLWLTLRRTIAIAELIGLPRAWYTKNDSQISAPTPGTTSSSSDRKRSQRVSLWEAICATDRMASMMFNLPAATATHKFPRRPIISPEGEVVVSPYIFELAGLAMEIQELDEQVTLSHPKEKIYERVLAIEGRLRALKAETPRNWWAETPSELHAGQLVQFWHYYLTTRIHLHLAMSNDDHDQFAYSRQACTEACESMARRYWCLRRLLPRGFFVCRIIDMQIFTAAAYLCLSCIRQRQNNETADQTRIGFIEQIVDTMDFAGEQMGGDFVREAAPAVRSLLALVKDPNGEAAGPQTLTLRIPLLGKIRIGRQKLHQGTPNVQPEVQQQAMSYPLQPDIAQQGDFKDPIQQAAFQQQLQPTGQFNMDANNTMPWLMELDMNASSLQDPFLHQDFHEFEQWLGMNNNPWGLSV
ncbi:hypothetical protein M409DRAFT_59630 [Zasmidium cellare ATCC 36951]|uniref:Transcription factor domain-containing protein n=1 Tax=Zasmidium cellare ATCC 36951 TaxID=1080233 RepID=A0A6A6C1U1_ZASCE|nr:uncharacterized protein M409DRAFT_59630 [Zasmidium cellare ATCC 36951]KAF2160843.1 hypothetical protein M409DRAFT_59630 [Zasmidium cellare ATCC 36951]